MSPLNNRFLSDPAVLGTFSLRSSSVREFPPLPPHSRKAENAVVTWVAGDAAQRWFSITGPAMERYARRVKADLVVIEGYTGQWYSLANKFRAQQVLTQYQYDRILFVDADALIQDHCVDLFSLVPADHLAILDELPLYDEWMLARYRREAMSIAESQSRSLIGKKCPPPRNSGLYLLPYSQAFVLEPPKYDFPICSREGATIEQTWMSLQAAYHRTPIFQLKYPEHHWVWYADQSEELTQEAMVLHFAGMGGAADVRYRRLRHYADGWSRSREPCVPCERIIDGSKLIASEDYDHQLMLDAPQQGAFKIQQLRKIGTHLHGWDVATKCLSVLENDRGVILDDFVESSFLWHSDEAYQRNVIPYRRHWVGFIHNPPDLPNWPSIAGESVRNLGKSPFWHESLQHCLGLFALTKYLADWVENEWKVPCEVVRYPTIRPRVVFSSDAFNAQSVPSIVCIGFWRRRFSSFDALRADGYRKRRINPIDESDVAGLRKLREYEREERQFAIWSDETALSAETIPRLGPSQYDETLSRSVVFLDLIDASGVTTIVECIVRGTPILINRIAPVEEYLGSDYPLYYSSREEADRKLQDRGRIIDAHRHLLANPIQEEISPKSFIESITSTATYKRALSDLLPGRLVRE